MRLDACHARRRGRRATPSSVRRARSRRGATTRWCCRQRAAIVAVLEAIKETQAISRLDTIIKHGARVIEGLLRTFRKRIQRMPCLRIKSDSPLTPWLARHTDGFTQAVRQETMAGRPTGVLSGCIYVATIADVRETVMAKTPGEDCQDGPAGGKMASGWAGTPCRTRTACPWAAR